MLIFFDLCSECLVISMTEEEDRHNKLSLLCTCLGEGTLTRKKKKKKEKLHLLHDENKRKACVLVYIQIMVVHTDTGGTKIFSCCYQKENKNMGQDIFDKEIK